MKESPEKIRNLQSTDKILDPDFPDDINGTEIETGTPISPPKPVSVDSPVSVRPKNNQNKEASYQFTKFHGFKKNTREKKVEFGVFLWFYNVPIARILNFRLKIVYSGRLRSLQEAASAESVQTNCTIVDENLAGTIGNGDNINYNCGAETTQDIDKISNVTLNTDADMLLDDKPVNFRDVNFNGDTAEESNNLIEADVVIQGDPVEITDAYIETPIQRDYLKIIGKVSKGKNTLI